MRCEPWESLGVGPKTQKETKTFLVFVVISSFQTNEVPGGYTATEILPTVGRDVIGSVFQRILSLTKDFSNLSFI